MPRCLADAGCLAAIEGQPAASRATRPTGADAKWRFFWRLGARPATTSYAELNADPVVPRGATRQPAHKHPWQHWRECKGTLLRSELS